MDSDNKEAVEKILFAEERKKDLVDYINQQGRVTVPELCENFSVSSATIRNDLRELDDIGVITRTHGGAIKNADSNSKYTVMRKAELHSESTDSIIATLAVKNIEDGDTIILDSGFITREMAKILDSKRNITVVTNDLIIGGMLEKYNPAIEIFIVGGVVRRGKGCTVSNGMFSILNSITVDKAFMNISSFSLERGAGVSDVTQTDIKKQMLAVASKVVLLCESEKLETDSFVNFAPAQNIDMLITDNISTEVRQAYEEKEIVLLTP